MKRAIAAIAITLALVVSIGCAEPAAPTVQQTTWVAPSPTSNTPIFRSGAWRIQDPEISPIDGVKTQFISLESNESSRYSDNRIEIVLCFENGKLTHKHVGARVGVGGFVAESDGGSVRLKFDDEKPTRESWGVADSHDALFPFRNESYFLARLLKHKTLAFEFSYYEKAAQTVTFNIAGLADAMRSAGLDPSAGSRAAKAGGR
jgi:hypothetical protein